MAITLPITSRTSSDDNDFADVYGNDAQLVTEINARDSVYKTLLMSAAKISADAPANTLILHGGSVAVGATATTVGVSGGDVYAGGLSPPPLYYFDDADFTVSSKTQRLRLRAQVAANATASATTFTVGLYPVTVAGGADILTFTLGTVVSGSTVAIASPGTSAVTQGDSGDFAVPVDGAYALGVVTSGTLANGAVRLVYGYLQTRHV